MRDALEVLTIRSARPGDRDAMLRITKDVWQGTDYLPYVWQRWLDDPFGNLCVAVWGDRVVGLQHIDVQPDGGAWIEGIRVDETMRGRGIGAAMLHHGLDWARAAGCPVARLSTASVNEASMSIARNAGLRDIARYAVLSGPSAPSPEAHLHVRPAHVGDLAFLCEVLQERSQQNDGSLLYSEGWTVYPLTPRRLHLLVAVHALVIAESTQPVAVGIATASLLRPALRLGYLQGSEEGMAAITAWMQGRAAEAGLEAVRAVVACDSPGVEVLQSRGFASSSGIDMVLWEAEL